MARRRNDGGAAGWVIIFAAFLPLGFDLTGLALAVLGASEDRTRYPGTRPRISTTNIDLIHLFVGAAAIQLTMFLLTLFASRWILRTPV